MQEKKAKTKRNPTKTNKYLKVGYFTVISPTSKTFECLESPNSQRKA